MTKEHRNSLLGDRQQRQETKQEGKFPHAINELIDALVEVAVNTDSAAGKKPIKTRTGKTA